MPIGSFGLTQHYPHHTQGPGVEGSACGGEFHPPRICSSLVHRSRACPARLPCSIRIRTTKSIQSRPRTHESPLLPPCAALCRCCAAGGAPRCPGAVPSAGADDPGKGRGGHRGVHRGAWIPSPASSFPAAARWQWAVGAVVPQQETARAAAGGKRPPRGCKVKHTLDH